MMKGKFVKGASSCIIAFVVGVIKPRCAIEMNVQAMSFPLALCFSELKTVH